MTPITQYEWDELKKKEQYGMYAKLATDLDAMKKQIESIKNSVTRDMNDQWQMISELMKMLKEEGSTRVVNVKELLEAVK